MEEQQEGLVQVIVMDMAALVVVALLIFVLEQIIYMHV